MKEESSSPVGKSVRYNKYLSNIKRRKFSFLEEYILGRGFEKVTDEVQDGVMISGYEKVNKGKTIDAIGIGIDTKNSQLRLSYGGSSENKYVATRVIEMIEKKYG